MQQPGRPREFDPDETLSKIMQLFWENGYEATGLSEIMSATGLGKASLYKAFGNKQSMYLKALTHYEGVMVDAAVALLRSKDLAPLDRIDAFLSSPIAAVRDHHDRRGCFLCNAAADRASLDDETRALVQKGYDKMRKSLIASLSDALPQMSRQAIAVRAESVLTLYSGLRVMSRAGQTAERMLATKDQVIKDLKQ
ncbi:TetR/AcrR family transcriptional regulator [Primorskyibacter sp. S187A]|uniref:TetR/AcrR family transcriptional regulator n=1 Tax=Primorskyibacter sp. S187A TaxID=3415130 RepID=UPI003C7BC002